MIKSFTLKKEMINDIYLPELESYDKRINVFYGGAGSGKSVFVIQKLIFKLLKFPGRRLLVVRKTQQSQRDSTFTEFQKILSDWDLISFCRINKSFLEIELPNGSLIIFKGLDDVEKIKSISGIDDIIIEEASEINLEDFSQLNLRLRSSKGMGQIHLMFNPVSKENWVYKMWFADGVKIADNTKIIHTNYLDNRFLKRDYIEELKALKEINYSKYKIYVLGEFATLDKLIYQNVYIEDFDVNTVVKSDPRIKARFGLDFGYTADPTAFIALLHDDKNKIIYVYDEFYERGLLTNEIANEIVKRGYRKEAILADSADPRTIDELRALGIPKVVGAKKGYIMSGIQFIQQHRLVVHPSCINTIEELKNFTWKKNKDGEYINKPIDEHDHLLDAMRYALSDIYNIGSVKFLDKKLLGF